jgi:hypothetical protein
VTILNNRHICGAGSDGSVSFTAMRGHAGQSFGRIILRKSMIVDHLCATYMEALKSAMES